MVPCKECLILAMCINLKQKDCGILYKWIKEERSPLNQNGHYDSDEDMWSDIRRYLPNLLSVAPEIRRFK